MCECPRPIDSSKNFNHCSDCPELHKKQHKWHKEIKAWADGKEIEQRYTYRNFNYDNWEKVKYPLWQDDKCEYRIKPEPKPDVVRYLGMQEFCFGKWEFAEDDFHKISHWPCKLKLTFDGETGKLKHAEILK